MGLKGGDDQLGTTLYAAAQLVRTLYGYAERGYELQAVGPDREIETLKLPGV